MAKKLAPLVIPAVIDTSGIDKGVNSIRSKLSRVRGQGTGGGGIGGGGGGFSSGITPYGLPLVAGGGSATAAAMAAAFGAAAGQRQRNIGVGNFRAGKGEIWAGVPRGATNWAARNYLTRQTTQKYYEMRLRNADFKEEPQMWENLDAAQQGQQRYFETLQRQQDLRRSVGRGMRKRGMVRGVKDAAESALGMGGIGSMVTALVSGERLLREISPVGIKDTLADLKPFESRAAGQYDIVQGMRNRAITAEAGNIGPRQAFLLGAGQAAGGGVTRTENVGKNLYEGLVTAAGTAGGLFEQTLSAGVGFVEGGLQRAFSGGGGAYTAFNPMMNPFNWIKRLYN